MKRELTITAMFPAAIPVSLAGMVFLIDEIRIADLVDLQRWIERGSVGPMDAIREKIDGSDHKGRERALWEAYDALRAPPVEWGSPEAARRFRTPEGLSEMFRVILRWNYPGLAADPGEIDLLRDRVADYAPGSYWDMVRAWRRVDPLQECQALLGLDDPGDAEKIGYPRAIAEVVELTGYDLDRIARLHLSQFNLIRSGGKAPELGKSVAPKSGTLKEQARQRRARYRQARGEGD